MGNNKSKKVAATKEKEVGQGIKETQTEQKRYEYLAKITNFDEMTIRLINSRFKDIDGIKNKDGNITKIEFCELLNISENSLMGSRFYNIMDKNNTNSLNFTNFVKTLSILNEGANILDKIDLSFKIYDINNDGILDRNEIKLMVNDCLNEIKILKLNNQQIEQLLDITFEQCKSKKYGEITKKEYKSWCLQNPTMLRAFNMDVTNLITYKMDEKRRNQTLQNHEMTALLKQGLHHGPLVSPRQKKASSKKLFRQQKTERVVSVHDIHEFTAKELDLELDSLNIEYSQSTPNKSPNKTNFFKKSQKIVASKVNKMPYINEVIPKTNTFTFGNNNSNNNNNNKSGKKKRKSIEIIPSNTSQTSFDGYIGKSPPKETLTDTLPNMQPPLTQISLSSDNVDYRNQQHSNNNSESEEKEFMVIKKNKKKKFTKFKIKHVKKPPKIGARHRSVSSQPQRPRYLLNSKNSIKKMFSGDDAKKSNQKNKKYSQNQNKFTQK